MPVMTITTTTAHATRVAAAIGNKLGLPGSANNAQVTADVIDYLKTVTRDYERQQAMATASDAVVDITPT